MSEEAKQPAAPAAAAEAREDRAMNRIIAEFEREFRARFRADKKAVREMYSVAVEVLDQLEGYEKKIDNARSDLISQFAWLSIKLGNQPAEKTLRAAVQKANVLLGPIGILAEGGELKEQAVKDWGAGCRAWAAQFENDTHEEAWRILSSHEPAVRDFRRYVETFANTYCGQLEQWLDDLHNGMELELFYDDLNVARLWEIERARIALHICRGMTGLTFSTLGELADVAKSTVTRFMSTPVPRYVIRDSSLLPIVQAATRQLDDDQGMELGVIYGHLLNIESLGLDTGDFDTVDELVEALLSNASIKSEWLAWGAAQAASDRNDTRGVTIKHTEDGPRIVSIEPGRTYMGTPPGRIVNASASASMEFTASASAALVPPTIALLGQVAAGVFQEAHQWDEDDWEPITLPDNYGVDAFGLRVKGDSMDREFPEGSVLVCRPYSEEHDDIPIDKYVIADRTDTPTGMVESTCKKLVENNGNYVLVPESTNPAHTPLPLMDLGEQSVRIRAVVIGAIIKF
jgi:SOS-response transcriptional repressor LexA